MVKFSIEHFVTINFVTKHFYQTFCHRLSLFDLGYFVTGHFDIHFLSGFSKEMMSGIFLQSKFCHSTFCLTADFVIAYPIICRDNHCAN